MVSLPLPLKANEPPTLANAAVAAEASPAEESPDLALAYIVGTEGAALSRPQPATSNSERPPEPPPARFTEDRLTRIFLAAAQPPPGIELTFDYDSRLLGYLEFNQLSPALDRLPFDVVVLILDGRPEFQLNIDDELNIGGMLGVKFGF